MAVPHDLVTSMPRRRGGALRSLARRLREYALLMRLDRPIGTFLLLWPVLWALWIAGNGRPDERILVVFLLGVAVMRAAGCVINDFADRDIDPHVKRTRERPVAARRVSPVEALVLFGVLIAAAFIIVLQLDRFTVQLAFLGAALTMSYPFVKRFFPLPQVYLGLSFGGFGVLMAFAAQAGNLPRVAWVLYLCAVLWAVVYDTIYALIDREDDLRIGVRSSAILFADMDRAMTAAMQAMMVFGLWIAGRSLGLGSWYHAGLIGAAVLFAWQQWLIRDRDGERSLRAFQNNNYVGAVVFAGIALDYLFRA
jgi:4-hydroxybenzoate polyprenyltransferase